MTEKENALIAYNELRRTIIQPGFCTLCGACEAACPVHALKIEGDRVQHIQDCSENLEFCPICYDVCPHTEALLLEALGFVTDAPHRRESLGNYRDVMLAQALNPVLRKLSHGGGVITAVLMDSIQKKSIDSAIVSEETTSSPELQPSISLVPDDILSAVDAGFFPSAVAKAFGKAVHEYGKAKIAFVGTPCQVLAIRKLECWEHKITGSLKLVIGLMCLWSFSLKKLLENIRKKYGIKPSEIQKISLDNDYRVYLKDRIIKIPVDEAKRHILKGCLTCNDFTAQVADISVGSAHPLDDWSIVVVRTKIGEETIEEAIKSGAIRTKKLEQAPEVFTHLVEIANFKRETARKEIDRCKATSKPVPPATQRLLRPIPKELGLLSSLSVSHIMTSDVMTVSPDTTVDKLLDMMAKFHHTGYPVLDDNKKLAGVVSFDDIIRIDPGKRCTTKVDGLKQEAQTVYYDDSALSAYERMIEHNTGRILVVERQDPSRILGIVTRTDIMQTLRWPMKLR
jgi:coenzyme F420 hydrogenase subunit beta